MEKGGVIVSQGPTCACSMEQRGGGRRGAVETVSLQMIGPHVQDCILGHKRTVHQWATLA